MKIWRNHYMYYLQFSFPSAGFGSKNWLRPGNWARDLDFSLGKLNSVIWSSIFNLFWWYIWSNLLVGCPSVLPIRTPCPINYLQRHPWTRPPGCHSNLALHSRSYIILLWQLNAALSFCCPLISIATRESSSVKHAYIFPTNREWPLLSIPRILVPPQQCTVTWLSQHLWGFLRYSHLKDGISNCRRQSHANFTLLLDFPVP